MKFILYFLILSSFSSFSQSNYYLAFCDHYKDQEVDRNVPIVIVVQGDSIRTYIDHFGYIWWHIDAMQKFITLNDTKVIDMAELYLSYKEHRSYITIGRKRITQLVLLRGNPDIILTIELKRRYVDYGNK